MLPQRFAGHHGGNRTRPLDEKDEALGADDKAQNKAEELTGQAKEGLGRAADDEELQTDQATSDLNQAGDNVKDAFKD